MGPILAYLLAGLVAAANGSDKSWLTSSDCLYVLNGTAPANESSPLYLFKNHQEATTASTRRPAPLRTDLDTSASTLRLSQASHNSSSDQASSTKQPHQQHHRDQRKRIIINQLFKGKRLVAGKESKRAKNTTTSGGGVRLLHRPPAQQAPFLARSLHHQPLLPYTGNHLLFGSQLSLPSLYNFAQPPPPGAPPEPLAAEPFSLQPAASSPNQHHQVIGGYHHDYHPAGQGELTPIFFPAAPATTGRPPAKPGKHQAPQQNKTQPTTNSTSSWSSHSHLSLPLGAAAAALFSERAKQFINQFGALAAGPSSSKKKEPQATASNSSKADLGGPKSEFRHQSGGGPPQQVNPVAKGQQPDNLSLASMIKNDPWAAPGSEPAPSIIVEHDGPAITTVDFGVGAHQHQHPMGPAPNQANEEDEVNSFYEGNEEEEESEVGGSHEAKRFAKYHKHPTLPHSHHPHHPHHPHHSHHSHHSHHQQHQPLPSSQHQHQPQHQQAPHFSHHQHQPHVARYPFEQQVQSHTVHTEVPLDSFYNIEPAAYGARSRLSKQTTPGEYPEFPPEALQEYLRLQKTMDQPIYPDSINAIKEQTANEDGGNKLRGDLVAALGAKLSGSNSDQIEQLIKELQELNKKKRVASSSGDDSSTPEGDSSKGNKKTKAKDVSDDYEDILGGFGGGGGGGGGGGDNNADDEDERIKLLRKKLLARLRGKRRRGGGGGNQLGGTGSESSFHQDAIKIPLHALLLAALDRRMSPSEPQSQTQALHGLIGGGSNEDSKGASMANGNSVINEGLPVSLGRQQDFNEVTTGLGSLIGATSGNHFYADSSTTPVPQAGETFAYDNLTNQEHQHQAFPQTPNMFILNNIRLPDQLQVHSKGNESLVAATIESAGETNASKTIDQQEDPFYAAATTRVPSLSQKKERKSARDEAGDSSKKRRELDRGRGGGGDGDFDVNRQVDEFTRDRNEQSLEPDWARRRIRAKANGKSGLASGPVQFDDDFEELAKATQRKILKRRRRPTGRRPKVVRAGEPASIEQTEAELRFLNKVNSDTAGGLADLAAEEPKGPGELDDEEIKDHVSRASAPSPEQILAEEEAEIEEEHLEQPADKARAQGWKPNMIDEEVRRLEGIARNKEAMQQHPHQHQPQHYEASNDYADQEEAPNPGLFEEAESCDNNGTSIRPDSVIRVTIDSLNGTSGARIIQHYKEPQPYQQLMNGPGDDYFFYSKLALYLGVVIYVCLTVLFFTYLCLNKCSSSENNNQVINLSKKHQHASSKSDSEVASRQANASSKSAASKTLPIYVIVPSLTNSSVITQNTLENLVPKLVSATSLSPKSPQNNIQTTKTPPRKPQNSGKSLKLSEHAAADLAGKLSAS